MLPVGLHVMLGRWWRLLFAMGWETGMKLMMLVEY